MLMSVSTVKSRAVTRSSTLVFGLGMSLISGCATGRTARSYLPVGAGAQYGANTDDGVTWTVARPVEQARSHLASVLNEEGYRIDDGSRSASGLRTLPRVTGGDTTLVVHAQFLAVALPEPGTSIVLTATYSVAARQIRNAPVFQRAEAVNPLYAYLLAIRAAAHRSSPRTER